MAWNKIGITTCLGLSLAASAAVGAAKYPEKPITVVVPFAAGGGIDVIARVVGNAMQSEVNVPVIVENRPGASGNIGLRYVSDATPDGYTLLASNNTMVTNAAIERRQLGIGQDFIPVAALNTAPLVLAVHPSVPATTVPELVQYLQTPNTNHAFSSCGVGTVLHLAGELFKQVGKVDMEHIPYQGCGPAVVDGLGGHVPILFNTIPNVLPHAEKGDLRILAVTRPIDVTLNGQPLPVLYEIPGYEEIRAEVWSGVFAPRGTSPERVAEIHALIESAKSSPNVTGHFAKSYQIPISLSPEAFSAMVTEDLQRWSQVVIEADIRSE